MGYKLMLTLILRIINAVIIITIYKLLGVDWVIVYAAINIDAYLDKLFLRGGD